MKFDYMVTRGRVIVNYVECITDRNHFKYYEIDLKSKYAKIIGSSINTVILDVTEETIHTNDDKDLPTVVGFDVPKNEDWHMMCDIGRYTVRVVFWR